MNALRLSPLSVEGNDLLAEVDAFLIANFDVDEEVGVEFGQFLAGPLQGSLDILVLLLCQVGRPLDFGGFLLD